jgi:F-type H+-transporting ATPase subunit alpha
MQPEFAPVSMAEQITVLGALTADLFDDISLAHMPAAEQAVRGAAANISDELIERLESSDKLSKENKTVILQFAREALDDFLAGAGLASSNRTDKASKQTHSSEPS